MPEATNPPPRSFRRHFQNWLSWAGMVLAAAALFAFVFLFAIDFFAPIQNPYVGILAYVIAPFFLLLGLALTLLGAILHKFEERRAGRLKRNIEFSRSTCHANATGESWRCSRLALLAFFF